MNFEFDPDDLSVGELCDLSDVAGENSLTEIVAGQIKPKVLLAIVWIVGRRDNPAFTLDDAKAVKVVDIQFPDAAAEPVTLAAAQ